MPKVNSGEDVVVDGHFRLVGDVFGWANKLTEFVSPRYWELTETDRDCTGEQSIRGASK